MSNYADLQEAFGDKYPAYCQHYEQYDKNEGRIATVLFDSSKKTTEDDAFTVKGSVIGSYSTNYNARIARATNVELAVFRINGVVLEPGQEFPIFQGIRRLPLLHLQRI